MDSALRSTLRHSLLRKSERNHIHISFTDTSTSLRYAQDDRERGGQTGPSRSFMSVSVRDGTRKRCPEGENGTITQSFGQKVA